MRIGVGLSIPELATRGGRFSPASLFTSGVAGAWYDPSDYSTLYQDSAGTTPVTAVEQPVGLMLDKSQGLVLGPDLVTNGDNETALFSFGSLINQDTLARASAPSGGFAASFTSSTSSSVAHRSYDSASSLLAGKNYRFTGRVYVPTGGVSTFRLFDNGDGSWFGVAITAKDQWVSFDVIRTAKASNWSLGIGNNVAEVVTSGQISFWLDNLSVRELPGNHARQATPTSCPVLRARYNLLTYSEQFNNSFWTSSAINATATADQATAPNGTVTADLLQATAAGANAFLYANPGATTGVTYTTSIYVKRVNADWFALSNSAFFAYFNISAGTVGSLGEGSATITDVGSGWWRIVWSGQTNVSSAIRVRAVTANNNTNVSGGEQYYIWGADLRTGSSAGTYQRIAAATDYATAGFLPYLALDGTDDSLASGSINFSGTNEMSVCAGVTKLSDAAVGMLVELSADLAANNGSFSFYAPSAASPRYAFFSKGTSRADAEVVNTIYAAPQTSVLTGIGGISAPNVALRFNGAQVVNSTATQGTGNYGNYPLYIGRRNNASLPFNGRIYQMVVCGKTLSASELASTEAYVNSKTGAY